MKSFKLIAMAAATLVLGISSCSKEEGIVPSADMYKVTLNFKNASTRADGATAVPGTTVEINDGYLCFVSANGAITRVFTISDDATDVSGNNIKNSELGSTPVVLGGIPGNSKDVYLITNTGFYANLDAPAVGNTISSYLANSMDVRDQRDYTGVTTLGSAPLVAGIEADQKTAIITLSTKVSRIQIKGMTFDGDVTGTVAGIFINGYYRTMQLNGTGSTFIGSIIDVDYNESGSAIFPSTHQGIVFDAVNKNFDTDVETTVVPTTANGVWGYNLFVSTTPQVIIKFTDVFVDGQEIVDPQFITINGFKNQSTQAPIANLEGGMMYTINTASLVIKFENMSPDPGVKPIQVDVTVVPVTWEETPVDPNI
ncbi:MAG: hypothetical protein FWD56_06080 [Bacteroidales bacterium]|nr:hypothetical protein [Bacteroidales bacterium]